MPPALHGAAELDGGQLSPLSESYFTTNPAGMHTIVQLKGNLNLTHFKAALQFTLDQYPALASKLVEYKKGPYYFLKRTPAPRSEPLIISQSQQGLTPDNYFEAIQQLTYQTFNQPFQLFEEAPARFLLLSFPDDDYAFVINTHHTCADGYIIARFIQIMMQHYQFLVTQQAKQDNFSEWAANKPKPAFKTQLSKNLFGAGTELYLRKRHPLAIKKNLKRALLPQQASVKNLRFSSEDTQKIIARARAHGVSVTDWLNLAIIQSIDKLRDFPAGLMPICFPVNLRFYQSQPSRHANLTSGIYLHIHTKQRRDLKSLIYHFVSQKKTLLKAGRAYFNLVMLQKIYQILRLKPFDARQEKLQRSGAYPATFICSNLGDFKFFSEAGKPRDLGQGLYLTDIDTIVFPNRNTDYLFIALSYNNSLKLCLSTDPWVVQPHEASSLAEHIKWQLLNS